MRALYTKLMNSDDHEVDVYLVPSTATGGEIVGVEDTRKHDVYVWSRDEIQVDCDCSIEEVDKQSILMSKI